MSAKVRTSVNTRRTTFLREERGSASPLLAFALVTLIGASGVPVPHATPKTITITDNDAAPPVGLPVVSVAVTSATSVVEGADASFTLTRTGGDMTASLQVNVSASDGTGDFISGTPPAMVTFVAGSATYTYTVSTVDDTVDEADGSVTVTVLADTASPATYTVAASPGHEATVTVTDDDDGPFRFPDEVDRVIDDLIRGCHAGD